MKKKTLSILCTEEQRNQIKLLAKKENLTLSNFVLSKLLNLKPVKEDIIKECPMTIVDKKGNKKKYIREYVFTKVTLMPMNNNNSSQSIREDIIIKECPMTIVDKKGNKKKYTKKYVCKKIN